MNLLVIAGAAPAADAATLPPATLTGWSVVLVDNYSPCRGPIAPDNCSGDAAVTTTGSAATSNLPRVVLGGAPFAADVTPDGSRALVLNIVDSTISTVDLHANPVRTLAPVRIGGNGDSFMAMTPDGRTAFVSAVGASSVIPIDLTSSPPVAGTPIHVGTHPSGIAVSADGSTAWVINSDAGTIEPIHISRGTYTPGTALPVGSGPSWIALSPDGATAYVTRGNAGAVTAVALDGSGTATVRVGLKPAQIVVTPDGSTAYVPNFGSGTVSPIHVSGTSMTPGAPFALPHGSTGPVSFPFASAVSPDGKQLYVTDGGPQTTSATQAGNTATEYDISRSTMAPAIVRTITTGGFEVRGIAITPPVIETTSGPSSIANSLPTPSQAFAKPVVVVASIALATGGVLFITFPAQLFNLTFDENYEAIARWMGRRKRRFLTVTRTLRRAPANAQTEAHPGAAESTRGLRLFLTVLAAGALLGSLLDPAFGANSRTVASYVGVVLAILLGTALRAAVTAVFQKRRNGRAQGHLRALPLGLLVAAICVAVSRLASFQPGYLYGVVCGVVFAGTLTARDEGRLSELTTVVILGASVLAWLLWVPVKQAAIRPGAFGGIVILDDLLASFFVGGLVGTALGLFPLRFLPGHALKEWSTPIWAMTFVVTLFGVVDVLILSSQSSGDNHAPLLTTVLLFVIFGGATVGLREYFARRWRAEHNVSVHGLRGHVSDLLRKRPPDPEHA